MRLLGNLEYKAEPLTGEHIGTSKQDSFAKVSELDKFEGHPMQNTNGAKSAKVKSDNSNQCKITRKFRIQS